MQVMTIKDAIQFIERQHLAHQNDFDKVYLHTERGTVISLVEFERMIKEYVAVNDPISFGVVNVALNGELIRKNHFHTTPTTIKLSTPYRTFDINVPCGTMEVQNA